MNCHICNARTETLFNAVVLHKYCVPYQYCTDCDHVFVDNPTWLHEAYSAVTMTDTDIAMRNIFSALRLAAIYYLALGDCGDGRYVDVAGGYGLLTRLMRDLGFDCYWSDRYQENLFARGFEYDSRLGSCSAISAFEVLEHTVNPIEFVQHNLAHHQTDTLVFTTESFPDNSPPAANKWSYYSFENGQHIAFFSRKGLARLAARLGLQYFSLGRIHLFTRKPLSPIKLRLASHKLLVVPIALYAMYRLGSKREPDRMILQTLSGFQDKK
jgi:hypothetical protein